MLAVATTEESHTALVPRPRYLSLRETVVLAGVSEKEKCVRKDIEVGVLSAPRVVDFNGAQMCFNWPYVVTFAAVYSDDEFVDSRNLRKSALEKILFAVSDDASIACWNSVATNNVWQNNLLSCLVADKRVNIGRFFELNIGKVCETVKPRVDLYATGLSRIDEDSEVLGGRPVFKGTRLSVHHVGKMVENGEAIANILEDYSFLSEGDVHFAVLYNMARPLVGRPRASGPDNAINVG